MAPVEDLATGQVHLIGKPCDRTSIFVTTNLDRRVFRHNPTKIPVSSPLRAVLRHRHHQPRFRPTKALIGRAAKLERRKLTDFCMTALTDAARRTIAEHETLVLSDKDRSVFFDALINPPPVSDRLQRAFTEHKRRTGS